MKNVYEKIKVAFKGDMAANCCKFWKKNDFKKYVFFDII